MRGTGLPQWWDFGSGRQSPIWWRFTAEWSGGTAQCCAGSPAEATARMLRAFPRLGTLRRIAVDGGPFGYCIRPTDEHCTAGGRSA